MSNRLTGKVALVTGASKGIGAEIARRLASEGARVAVNYSSDKAGADRVVAEIVTAGGKAVALHADLSDPVQAERLAIDAKAALGPIDILVNNAGIYELLPLDAVTPEHFHRQFNLNVLGVLLLTKSAVSQFNPLGGSIINISSGVSTITPANSAVYTATKAALDAISLVLAKELAPRHIRVNAVNPGMILTEGAKAAGIEGGPMQQWIEQATPLGRVGKVEEIAAAVAFFASDDASYVTGETLHVTGGLR